MFLGPLRLAKTALAATESPVSVTIVLSNSVRSPIAGLAVANGQRPGLGLAMAKTLADGYGSHGSRVNVLLPGRIATDRMQQLDDASGNAEKSRRRNNAGIPLGRYGKPEEFGRGSSSRGVTGRVIHLRIGHHRGRWRHPQPLTQRVKRGRALDMTWPRGNPSA